MNLNMLMAVLFLTALFVLWFFASTYAVYATADNFDCTNNREIIKQCTENKILIVNDSVIQCKVLDKKVLSGSE